MSIKVCSYSRQGNKIKSTCFELGGIFFCELKMDKQGLRAGESWWQNSNRSKSKKQNENETEIWIGKDGFQTGVIGSRLGWKIVETLVINC